MNILLFILCLVITEYCHYEGSIARMYKLPALAKVLENYNQLWHIEKAFRTSKTDLKVRPVYHRLSRRIEAHICLVFAAYKVYKELERQLKILQSPMNVNPEL